MTEENQAATSSVNEITADNVTKTQVDEFFDNGGKFSEKESKKEKAEVKDAPKDDAANTDKGGNEPDKKDSGNAGDEKPKSDKDGKIEYGALHEERKRRQALQKEVEDTKADRAKAQEVLKLLEQYSPNKNVPPEFDKDPVAAMKYELDQIKSMNQKRNEWEQNMQHEHRFVSAYKKSTDAFTKDAPDYRTAYNHLMQTRYDELQALGFDDAGAKKVIIDEEKWIVGKAYQDGVNPAQRIYNLALKRGYTKGAAKAAADAVEDKDNPANQAILDKLNNIEKGQKRNANLPNGSKSGKENLTVEELAGMDPDTLNHLFKPSEFDRMWEKHFGKAS